MRFMRCDKRWAAMIIVLFCAAPTLQSSEDASLVYRKKYVMGTVFEIAAYQDSSQDVSNAIEKAFREVVRIDDLFSNYKPESALSTLNRSAHLRAKRVPSDLYLVIEKAVELSKISEGKFDISIAPLVNLWKVALSGEATPTAAQERGSSRLCRLRENRFDSARPNHIPLAVPAVGFGRDRERLRRGPGR